MVANLPPTFKLERYFADYEFVPGLTLLCCSDPESWTMKNLLKLASEETKEMWGNLSLGYTDSQGLPQLREEAASLHGVGADEVLEIAPQEGIYIAMSCLVTYLKRKHQMSKFHVVTTYPGYQSLYENLKVANCDVGQWTVKDEETEWQFHMDDLKSLLRDDTKLLVVNFPHNPTGYIPDAKMWQEIVDLCKERDIFLFSDEMYRLTNNDGTDPLPSASAVYQNAITLFGVSKTFGLPGLRVGWLCTKNKEVVKLMKEFKDYISICGSAPSEILALIGLQNRDTVIKTIMIIVKLNLNILDGFFKKYADIFQWYRPKACTTGFVKLKGWLLHDVGGGKASGVCKALIDEAKVVLLPGSAYDFDDQYVRIGFGRKNLPQALRQLEDFIKRKQPK